MRISRDAWAIQLATYTAKRSTCRRRSVGCLLLNEKGHIIATGYNGTPMKFNHCVDSPQCPSAFAESGTSLDGCYAVHAEQNALLQCKDVWDIDTAYVTAAPCITCTKLLLNTSCNRIVFLEDYPTSGRVLWEGMGRTWEKFNDVLPREEESTYGRIETTNIQ